MSSKPARWSKVQVELIVNRLHVGTTDSAVAEDIARRTQDAAWTCEERRAATEYAVQVHTRNVALYRRVMGGN